MSSAQIRTAISGTVIAPIGTQIRGNLGLWRDRVFGRYVRIGNDEDLTPVMLQQVRALALHVGQGDILYLLADPILGGGGRLVGSAEPGHHHGQDYAKISRTGCVHVLILE